MMKGTKEDVSKVINEMADGMKEIADDILNGCYDPHKWTSVAKKSVLVTDCLMVQPEAFMKNTPKNDFDPRYIPEKMEKSLFTETSERIPDEDGEYVVVFDNNDCTFMEMCSYSADDEKFFYWDHYNDTEICVNAKDVKAWLKLEYDKK